LDPAPLRSAGCCRLPTHRRFSDQPQTVHHVLAGAVLAAQVGSVVQPVRFRRGEWRLVE
jgi:hypothetical protein